MANNFLRTEIEADINIRTRNLTLLKTMSARYNLREDDKNVWSRCAFPIIYAEWEGFFTSAFSIYFREINKLHLSLDNLSMHYFIRETEKNFKQLKNYPEKINQRHSFLTNLSFFFKNTGEISLKTDINTESNLGFNVVNNILSNLNLRKITDHINHNEYSLKKELDRFLLDTRNGIAHGNHADTISDDDIDKAIRLVELLMDEITNILEEGYNNQVFKKNT